MAFPLIYLNFFASQQLQNSYYLKVCFATNAKLYIILDFVLQLLLIQQMLFRQQ